MSITLNAFVPECWFCSCHKTYLDNDASHSNFSVLTTPVTDTGFCIAVAKITSMLFCFDGHIFATVFCRCDMLLLLCPLGLVLLLVYSFLLLALICHYFLHIISPGIILALVYTVWIYYLYLVISTWCQTKSFSSWEAIKYCSGIALLSIGWSYFHFQFVNSTSYYSVHFRLFKWLADLNSVALWNLLSTDLTILSIQ